MTVAVWRGVGGTASQPHGGDFEVASNWSGGVVPDYQAHAVLGAGKYTVTLAGAVQTVDSLQIGAGVTLVADQQDNNLTVLVLNNDSTNSGHLVISGAALQLNSGASLVNFGEIYAHNGTYTPSVQGSGQVINDGLIAGSDGTAGAILIVEVHTQNESDGVVNSRGGSRVLFSGELQNDGLVSAIDGGLINFTGLGQPGHTLNLGEGILTGGHWSAIGAGSTLNLYNSEISSLAGGAVVTLSGAGSQIGGESSGGVASIESTLSVIGDGTELHVLGDRDFYCGQDLDVGGLLQLGGGTLTTGLMIVHDDPGSTLSGYGVIQGDVEMYGLLRADNHKGHQTLTLTGDNDFFGNVGGRGTLVLSGGLNVLQTGSKVFVNDIVVDGQNSILQLSQDLVYDGKLQASAFGAVDLDGHVLRLNGKVTLDSGDFESGKLQLEGAQVTSTGLTVIDSDLRNDAVINVKSGLFVDLANVNGTGEFHVLNSSRLTFGGAVTSGQTVFMDGDHATLAVGTAAGFKGTVSGYGAGDVLNFEKVDAAGATFNWKSDGAGGGTLTLTNGAQMSSMHLEGAYQKSLFHLSAADDDGTNVTYGPVAAPDHAGAHWDAHGGLAI